MANLRLEGSSTSARAIASTRDKAGRAREGTKTDQRGPRHPPSAAACEKLALTKLYKKSPRGPASEACQRTYAHLPALHEAYQINSALQEKGLGRSRGFGELYSSRKACKTYLRKCAVKSLADLPRHRDHINGADGRCFPGGLRCSKRALSDGCRSQVLPPVLCHLFSGGFEHSVYISRAHAHAHDHDHNHDRGRGVLECPGGA